MSENLVELERRIQRLEDTEAIMDESRDQLASSPLDVTTSEIQSVPRAGCAM